MSEYRDTSISYECERDWEVALLKDKLILQLKNLLLEQFDIGQQAIRQLCGRSKRMSGKIY